jgi:hypothetical protein
MKFSEAKILCDSSILNNPKVLFKRKDLGWIIEFKSEKKIPYSLYLETEKGKLRVFRDVSAAIKVLKRLKFCNAFVYFEDFC